MSELEIPKSSMTGQELLEFLQGLSTEDLQRHVYADTCCDYNSVTDIHLLGTQEINIVGTK